MGIKKKCNKCERSYKVLTKEGLCVFCFKEKHGYWSDDFCSIEEIESRNKSGVRT